MFGLKICPLSAWEQHPIALLGAWWRWRLDTGVHAYRASPRLGLAIWRLGRVAGGNYTSEDVRILPVLVGGESLQPKGCFDAHEAVTF